MDEWVDIKDYEGYYQINRKGEVKSLARTIMRKNGKPYTQKEKILKPWLNGTDKDTHRYFHVELRKNGKQKTVKIHRLLAETFLLNPDNLEMVDHKNQNTKDNSLSNLRWASRSLNMINRKVMGKIKHKFIYETKKKYKDKIYESFVFMIQCRKEKNIAKTFNKKKYTLQDVINFRNDYCKENDIEIIE